MPYHVKTFVDDVPVVLQLISTEAESMNTAAERLLGLSPEQIQELAKDILGQLRLLLPR
jgi:flotillin